MRKIKAYTILYFDLIKLSLWAFARVWGYWFKNRQLPLPICVGYGTDEQKNWWMYEINRLNKRRNNLDKELYGK